MIGLINETSLDRFGSSYRSIEFSVLTSLLIALCRQHRYGHNDAELS